jgi:hypothetical protein
MMLFRMSCRLVRKTYGVALAEMLWECVPWTPLYGRQKYTAYLTTNLASELRGAQHFYDEPRRPPLAPSLALIGIDPVCSQKLIR